VLAQRLLRSPGWRRRALAVDIAAQLRRPTADEHGSAEYAPDGTRRLLLAGLQDSHDKVIEAAATGLGHRPDVAALPELVRLASHPSAGVRYGVTFAFGSYGQPEAIQALLKLAADADATVRDWATFALGTLHEVNSPEVRERLWQNLGDSCADVRGEAIMGLARRHDPRVVDHLLEHLESDCHTLDFEAAGILASPRLVPVLERLAANESAGSSAWHLQLHLALEACRGRAAQQE
jgi:HEAT repeat protein